MSHGSFFSFNFNSLRIAFQAGSKMVEELMILKESLQSWIDLFSGVYPFIEYLLYLC